MSDDGLNGSPWSSGSYIHLMLASVVMQFLFMLTAIWVGTNGEDFYESNLDDIRLALRMQLAMGWMMCLISGLGFSLLPIIYDVKGFDKSVMRIYIGMNVSGQIAIILAILSGKEEIFNSLATVGITLLCGSLMILRNPAMTIIKNKKSEDKKLGPFSYSIGALMPIIGLIILGCWVLRNEISGLGDFAEDLVFEFFIPLTIGTVIISHFNRRLDWEIIPPNNIGKVFAIYALLLLLALFSEPLVERDDISNRLSAILQFIPYMFFFIMLNPKKIISQIIEEMPHSKMVMAGVLWMPVIGFAGYMEAMSYVQTTDAMMSYQRWILIFGVAFQVLWGFAIYLHEDHKKVSIHVRKSKILILLSINIAVLITAYSMFTSWQNSKPIEQYPKIGIAMFTLSYLLILIYWLKETFFSLDNWYKTPMFYDKYLSNPKLGSGFDVED